MEKVAATPPSSPHVHNVAVRLHSAALHLMRRLRREDRVFGISAARLSALSVVVFGGPLTLGDLAAAEDVTPPTMSRLVAALETDGLVARVADPTDARIARIRATAKGRRVMERGRARRTATLAAQLATLPAEDVHALDRAAAIIERLLHDQNPA